eukprot:TRINITY_DN54291_c0_g1_i1.p1 TRINITY_DN54291_c0_g1~~TRINITY_DN54291_c0_g1_i1.p1  ORF type:complete len:796 (+),score=146.96 TRINITY_DN54291_c0_g1_i1:65-2452(+)
MQSSRGLRALVSFPAVLLFSHIGTEHRTDWQRCGCGGVLAATLPDAFLLDRVPAHNPEHSCPQARELDWPAVKQRLLRLAATPPATRRNALGETAEAEGEWRAWVQGVYWAEDLDFCPVGVQAVHLADVDLRLREFNATGLAEVFESQYQSFLTRMPLMLVVLSGWPVFRYLGQLADEARLLPDFTQALSAGICGGHVSLDDVLSLVRGFFESEAPAPASHLMIVLARVLSGFEQARQSSVVAERQSRLGLDCHLAAVFAHFMKAAVLGGLDASGAPKEGVVAFFGKIMQSVEAGELIWHSVVRAATAAYPLQGWLHAFAGGWPLWRILDRLQTALTRPPWALRCSPGPQPQREQKQLCLACDKPQQAEWFREVQWIGVLLASGVRGEFGQPEGELLAANLREGAPLVLPAGGDDNAGDEAWATLLADDDAGVGQASEVLLTYLEAVRVLAHSVRRHESPARRRPFLVLMAASALTEEIREVLVGDGLTPLPLPTFMSEGVSVPWRRQGRGDVQLASAVHSDAFAAEGGVAMQELSWWMKIRLWRLTQYRRIVYLDADILVNRPIAQLFNMPGDVDFAAPAHDSRDGEGAEISVGVMSLRPNERIYEALVSFLVQAAPRLQTGVRSVDQTFQHAFFVNHFTWRGYPRWSTPEEGGGLRFAGCAPSAPKLHAGVDLGARPGDSLLGTFCVLPPEYDFCVSYPALVSSLDSWQLQDELASQFLPPHENPGGSWRPALRGRLLHWTGPRRKPWLHVLSIARTAFDELWWETHRDLCAKVSEAVGSTALPCRLGCDFLA